ncbi:hypothetical protein B9G55_12660 [Saccharibacillus sp. O16]|nr:hypothetical protein B9G55_12660 [Saccharibacillus sp. O16]
MTDNTAFTDEQWNKLIDGVADSYDDLTLKRGFQYERMGSVQQLTLSDDRHLEAEVSEGTQLCKVEVALEAPGAGRCDCKDRKPCRHQAAALMKLARLRGRPVSALANALMGRPKKTNSAERADDQSAQRRLEQPTGNPEPTAQDHRDGHAKRQTDNEQTLASAHVPSKDAANQSGTPDNPTADSTVGASEQSRSSEAASPSRTLGEEQAALLAASGISAWQRNFEAIASTLEGRTRNPKFAELTLAGIIRDMPPFRPGIEALYRLNAHLFVLRVLTASSSGYYGQLAVSETASGMNDLLSRPLPQREEAQVQERLRETLRLFRRQMLTEHREQEAFSQGYYGLLNAWVAPLTQGEDEQAAPQSENPAPASASPDSPLERAADRDRSAAERLDVYESELQYLMDEERELGRSLNRQTWLGANAWSRFCLGQDDRAKALLQEAADKPYFAPKKLPDFFAPLVQAGQWERLVDWLETFGPLLERARVGLADYGRTWDETLLHLPEAESRMWNTLSGMLPYASDFYSAKLMERERWAEWMDYQLSTGAEPSSFKVTQLAPLEKQAPQLLLPFYHQAVERLVEQRSRDGYKRAAKLIKRLEKLYKKMKREERWEAYMEVFQAKYGRLRALQEELKKGKLMP